MSAWTDPYPAMPPENDRTTTPHANARCAGTGERVMGELVAPNGIRLRVVVPRDAGDTARLPLVVTTRDCPRVRGEYLALVVYHPDPRREADYLAWLEGRASCSPVCSMLMLLGRDGLVWALREVARRLRFDHRRVLMVGDGECTYPVALALHHDMQPWFSGVTCLASEWQMAECPAVSDYRPRARAPRIWFGVGGCDHAFCPQLGCLERVRQAGFEVTAVAEANVETCPCPPLGGPPGRDRPHALPVGADIYASHSAWVLSDSAR